MADPTTRLMKSADARPDAHHAEPSTLPTKVATTANAAGRLEPAVVPTPKGSDPRPGEDSDDLHVVPADGNWAVKVQGKDARTAVTSTKAEAVEMARNLAKDRGVRVIIHKSDGAIQRSHDYA